ncbi:SRPBCC domain-containing protein [Paenibacillus filicis]|uniref:SRPBCC domain-containing protein n=1 Tax=Paenibacillus gyeongsangnamensis TaxID=3388067 RepID=A0ABT4QAR0_9BACL|nr:SRPBCC domain-containing protein [Paenibacillus filicis]MCZ8513956.1 SRPBCC domain-containing protein [Paenibacillus filicis]
MIDMHNGQFTLQLNHTYKASRDRVFQAWTKQDLLKQWWGPQGFTTTVDRMDVVEGGGYRFIMQAPNGSNHIIGGSYVEIVPNEKLVFTWKWEHQSGGKEQEETLVTIEFTEQDTGTKLVVTHENFSTMNEAENHNNGWSSSLEGFKHYLEQQV